MLRKCIFYDVISWDRVRQNYTLCWLRASWLRCSWQMFERCLNDQHYLQTTKPNRSRKLGDMFKNTCLWPVDKVGYCPDSKDATGEWQSCQLSTVFTHQQRRHLSNVKTVNIPVWACTPGLYRVLCLLAHCSGFQGPHCFCSLSLLSHDYFWSIAGSCFQWISSNNCIDIKWQTDIIRLKD